MDSEDVYNNKVEKDRKRLYNIIKRDDVDELKKCVGFVRNDLTGEIGTINERLKVGKELMPIEHAIDCVSEKCFDYMIGLECLDLTNNYTLINLAVNSCNKHFFDEISERDYTPYYNCTYGFKNPKLDCLRKMIEHPDFKFNNDLHDNQPSTSVFKVLVEMDVDFDKTEALINNIRSWTRSRKTIEYLISVGADINGERTYDTDGTITTPFICICSDDYNSKSLINYFLTRGGDPNSIAKYLDEDGNTVERSAFYMYLFKGNYDKKLVNKSIKKGAKYDIDDIKRELINRGRHKFLKYFIDKVVEDDIMYMEGYDFNDILGMRNNGWKIVHIFDVGQIFKLFYNKFGVDIFFYKNFHKKFNDLSCLLEDCSLTDILNTYKKKLSEYNNSDE